MGLESESSSDEGLNALKDRDTAMRIITTPEQRGVLSRAATLDIKHCTL